MSEPYSPYPSDLGDESFTRAYGIKTNVRRELGIGLIQMGVEHLGIEYTTLRCVKDRFTGRASGNTLCLKYTPETGWLDESEFPGEHSAPRSGRHGFEPIDGLDL
jgi:hypothetical protein